MIMRYVHPAEDHKREAANKIEKLKTRIKILFARESGLMLWLGSRPPLALAQ